jgi:hypothetical protein
MHTCTLEELAEAAACDPADVAVIVAELVDLDDDVIPDWVIAETHNILQPLCERTVPELWGHAGTDID